VLTGALIASVFVFLAAPRVAAQGEPGTLSVEPHAFETQAGAVEAELGRLVVPMCRERADGRTIELSFVRFASTAAEPGPPIVYLAGGPGTSGIDTARGPRLPIFLALRELADVIALDQRGVGLSRPLLECDHTWELPLDRPFDFELAERVLSERFAACRLHYEEDGIDLACFNTRESADDLDDLRAALGAEQISLWGISYGTHLGLATIRRHPERVHRAVLAGVEGPSDSVKLPSQIQANLERLAGLTRADPELSKRVPDLLELVRSVLEKLEREPAFVQVFDPASGGTVELVVGATDVRFAVARGMGSIEALQILPAAFAQLAEGDWRMVGPQLLQMRRGTTGSAMRWAMDCASGVSAERWARIEREAGETLLGNTIDFPLPGACSAWDVPDLGAGFRAPVRSDLPVLFISGTLDGRTPPANAEKALAGFPHGEHLVIEGAAHSDPLFLSTPRILEALRAFFAGAPVPVHRIVLPRIEFVAPPR
jgi:pimeloyl-ACP methyl ester carboxylesterase